MLSPSPRRRHRRTSWRAPHRLPRALAATAAALALAGALTACGSSSAAEEHAGSDVTASPAAEGSPRAAPTGGTAIDITLQGDDVEPAGTRVEVTRDQPVLLRIRADRAGELHVHSSPEQHIDFPAGASTATLRLAQPGVVDVEDHRLDTLIVQLEVR